MSTVIDDDTLMRVVALSADPDFIDIYGSITGTRDSTYKPTFLGERGFMLNADAAPLDMGVELTGDKLAICFNWTPYQIDQAMELVVWPVTAGTGPQQKPVPLGPYNVDINGTARKYWIDSQRDLVLFDDFGGDEIPDVGLHIRDLDKTLKEFPEALTQIKAMIASVGL